MRLSCIFILIAAFCATAQEEPVVSTIGLMNDVIAFKSFNNPENVLETLQYESYENLKIAGNPDAVTGAGYKKSELRRTLKRTQLYLSEKTSKHLYDRKKGKKEVINAAFVPGFEKPVYPIYNINFQTKNLYDDVYYIFDQPYASPLRDDAFKVYNFEQLNDSVVENRPVHIIAFTPTTNEVNTLSGKLYIDKETLGVARAQFFTQGNLDIAALHKYQFNRLHDIWLNTYSELFIRNINTIKELELFGGRFEVGMRKESESSSDEELYLILKNYNTDFKTNRKVNYGDVGVSIQVEPEALNTPRGYWLKYRDKEPLTTSDLAQFMRLDSVVATSNIEKRLAIGEKFKVGYIPIGFFDIDLKYLLKFNEYEAFRFGFGGTTNENLSEKWRMGGYAAYGTGDEVWKYKMNLSYRISEKDNTWLNIYKVDDINEFASAPFLTDARVYSLFEPRLVNIPTFYIYKEYGLSLQQRILPALISEISLSRKRISQTTDYIFAPNGNEFANYVLSELSVGARWSPKNSYLKSPSGYQITSTGYPILSAQIDKGFSNIVGSDFDYIKFSAKASYTIERLNNSRTELLLEGHYANGDVPLTHLFHAYPNAPTKDEILQRFSVAGRNSFETMFFNEFFSDRLITAQLRHQLAPLKIASWLQPEIVLTSRFALGSFNDMDDHLNVNFNRLNHGFTESGFEINKLFYGFGLSATYRYGAYHLPKFSDNIALKFTFYLEI